MGDRSSRPHRSPTRTRQPVVRRIVHLRLKQRLGPVDIAARLGMASSTVHAVLTRCHLQRLTHIDRVTGEHIRRYEHPYPGSMIHVDVKKLGNVLDGGGWATSDARRATSTGPPPPARPQPPPPTADGHCIRAHRHRRPIPRRLRPLHDRRTSPSKINQTVSSHPLHQPPWALHLDHPLQHSRKV